MIKEISIFGTILFFLSGIISPVFAYPNEAYEVFDYNENVVSLGIIYYKDNTYDLYKVGEVYVVLNSSGDIVKDQGITQNAIFTKFVSESAREYKKVYDSVKDNIIALKNINNLDFAHQLSLSDSLSTRASTLLHSMSYTEAYALYNENEELLDDLTHIKETTPLEEGGNTLVSLKGVLFVLGNEFSRMPIFGEKIGRHLTERREYYRTLIDAYNVNLEELRKISREMSQFSLDATTIASSSFFRIKSKQNEANHAYQQTLSDLTSTQDYIEDLFVKTFLESPEETPLYAAETTMLNIRFMIGEDEYNSAINDIEDIKLQIEDAKASAEDASILIDVLEFQVWKINKGIDVVDNAANSLSTKQIENLTITKNKALEIKTNLTVAERKFSDSEYKDAKKIALNSVVDSIEVISLLDSLISEAHISDGGVEASAKSISRECGYYE